MSQTTVVDRTRFDTEKESYHEPITTATETSLLDLLLNSIVLDNVIPYLGISSLLSLAATSQSFGSLVYHTPRVFRHVDLTKVKRAQFDIDQIDHGGQVWRNAQVDENLTEDE